MPRTVADIRAEIEESMPTKKATYQPARGEEAIFAAPEKGLLDYIGPLLPFYQQFTKQTPWQSPETAMEAIGWGMGGLMKGRGMAKEPIKKGASAISKALEDIFSKLGGSTGKVPATVSKAGLPEKVAGRFTHRPGDIVDTTSWTAKGALKAAGETPQLTAAKLFEAPASSLEEPRRIGESIRKLLPQYAGPTAPKGMPMPWRSRSSVLPDNIQDIIDDLMRESLKAKGLID